MRKLHSVQAVSVLDGLDLFLDELLRISGHIDGEIAFRIQDRCIVSLSMYSKANAKGANYLLLETSEQDVVGKRRAQLLRKRIDMRVLNVVAVKELKEERN